jgi:hypothetical protein
MPDLRAAQVPTGRQPVTPFYDLVVVGAGVAGLNALYAATKYLPRGARVLLVDQKPSPGGMWNATYDYVRLHQPHAMFTVGDLKWNWTKPSTYLARRDEVRDHLAGSLNAVAEAVDLETRFEETASACREVETDRGYRADVTIRPNADAQKATTIEAQRVIFAPGFNQREPRPLELSSKRVISVSPRELTATLATHPATPVYVVGGGKTGMDTVLATLAEGSGRSVSLINGRGTNFLNRTRYFPTGLRRWTSGELSSRLFRDIAMVFDGTNAEDMIDHFRRNYSTDPTRPNGRFLYGIQSEDEHARIARGLTRTYDDYLVDVVDSTAGPRMELRSGRRESVESDSIFVNCSGSLFRTGDTGGYPPCVSPHDTVASINTHDGFHFLTSVAGFFVTHLLYRGDLKGKGFYTLDHQALFMKDRSAWVGASAAQAYLNEVIAVQTLPMTVLDGCGLDLDRWYPYPRRVAGLFRMRSTARQDIAHCRGALERVAQRFGVCCRPIE